MPVDPACDSSCGRSLPRPHVAVRASVIVITPLALLCCIWLWALVQVGGVSRGPRAVTFGGDFALNMSSAVVLKNGGNPYDGRVLLRAEQSYMDRQGIRVSLGRAQAPLTWGGYPPLYFWLLEPLTGLPFQAVALAWIALSIAMMVGGFVAVLRFLDWRSFTVPAVLFVLMPETTLEAYYGNPTGLVVGIIFIASLLQKRYPLAAGLLLSLTFLKPQLAAPTLLLICLFHTARPRRVFSGVVAGLLVLIGATLVTVGQEGLLRWAHGLSSVSGMIAAQPNIAPLIGLYAGWTSQPLRTAIQGGAAVLALGLTMREWRRRTNAGPVPFLSVAWLWALWFLVLPYAHYGDAILLAPALLSLLGRNGENLRAPASALMLYLMFFSVFLFSAKIHDAQLLALPLVVLAGVLYGKRHKIGDGIAARKRGPIGGACTLPTNPTT